MAQMTEQQSAFVVAYVANGGNATQAAKEAGFSEKSARQIGGSLTRKDHVMKAIREEQGRLINGRLCTKALTVLESVLDNADAPIGARVDAAKTILDRGGLSARVTDKPGILGRDNLSDMSTQELQAFIERSESDMARIQKTASQAAH